ncbi:MAG: thioredoxin family protein [Candidatus Zhuqueibacterota bacterium]
MPEDIAKLIVGNVHIGIAGLNKIIEEVKAMRLSDEAKLQSLLLEKVKVHNYVPPSKENEYAAALLKFYQKSIGIQVETAGADGCVFYILGPGCPACDQLERDTKSILAELNVAAQVEHIRDVNEIASFGFIRTPALVLNEKVILSGRTIPINQLKKIFSEELNKEHKS